MIDLRKVKRYSIKDRKSLVDLKNFHKAENTPDDLGKDFKEVVKAIKLAKQNM